ncbi:hypothetical protein [Gimesia fumaroli]|uniref:Uncharacterized protein n=1 Tax=Gimesia fumaroli TaxID=2527976 RepID=A0A518IJU3_9PLAN|nr:hypothetical protein [Gimesia fumaroli]QDV53340.1 hypothetical protein Enr17x_54140 [Gimesia fumaroli]
MPTPLDQLDFGPNNDAVHEVIDLVQSGNILKIPFDQQLAETSGYKIRQIHTFEKIDLYRRSITDDLGNDKPYIRCVDWNEILHEDDNTLMEYGDWPGIYSMIKELEIALTSVFEQLREQIFILVNDQLKGFLIQEEADLIAEGLYMVCKSRALFSKDSGFVHESWFPIFQAGGYPCGWSGAFPRGQLVVFVPDPHVPCHFPERTDASVYEQTKKNATEPIRSQKPFSSDQPHLWHGIASLKGEYAYAVIDEHIGLGLKALLDTIWPEAEEQVNKESEAILDNIAGETFSLPEQFILALMLRGIEKTYFLSHPDGQDIIEQAQEIVETSETSGFAFEVSSKNQTVRFYHYDEDGYCDESLEVGLDGSDEIHFQSDLRILDIPLRQENLFKIVNDCFEYHGLCDLMLNYDALITGPDEQGLSTATFKRMPELKYEIDILKLD